MRLTQPIRTIINRLRRTRPRRAQLRPYESRSLENPKMSITDPDAWENIFGGTSSDAGVTVNNRTILEYSPIWQAVLMQSQDISCIPTFVYRNLSGGGKERANEHPAYPILRRKANPLMTAQKWKQTMVAQAIIFGNAYSVINRDQFATPLELLVLPPDATSFDTREGLYTTTINGQQLYFDSMDVFHLHGLVIDSLDGLTLWQYARNAIGKGMGAEKYGNKFFSNGSRPSGVFTHPGKLKPESANNLRNSLSAIHGGLDNSHRVAILEEGMTWNQIGLDPEQSQMIATLNFGVKDAARFTNTPPHRLGDDSKTSFNSVEQENLSYNQSTLTPFFCKLREEGFDKLLTEKQKREESHTVEELRVAILAADATTRANFYSRGLLDGWLNRDEVRNWENLNPIPDGEGQAFMVPLNMQLLGEEDEDQDDDDDGETTEEMEDTEGEENQDRSRYNGRAAAIVALTDATERACKRLAHYSIRASNRPDQFAAFLEQLEADHAQTIADMYGSPAELAPMLGVRLPEPDEMARGLCRTWRVSLEFTADRAKNDRFRDDIAAYGDRFLRDNVPGFVHRQLE